MNSPFKANPKDFVASTKEAFEVGQSSGSPAPERQQLKAHTLHCEKCDHPMMEAIGGIRCGNDDCPRFNKLVQPEAGDTVIEQAQAEERRTFGKLADQLSAADKALTVKSDRAAQRQKEELDKFSNVVSLDWKQIPPPMLAQILVSIPFKGSGSDPDYYLSPVQGMIFALRCFELGLSPFSNEVWFNSKNNKVNVTFEGKLKLARMHGMKLSPPIFKRIPEDATKPLVAYHCTIVSPNGPCEYTATLKEWMVSSSPVWKAKPDHMLQLRAAEKCLSFATGSGSSELMGEQDLQTGKEVENFIPSFTQEGK